MRSWSALTEGSSPKTSSPTGALAIASRMAGVGRVMVSLRKSWDGVVMNGSGGEPERVCGCRAYCIRCGGVATRTGVLLSWRSGENVGMLLKLR